MPTFADEPIPGDDYPKSDAVPDVLALMKARPVRLRLHFANREMHYIQGAWSVWQLFGRRAIYRGSGASEAVKVLMEGKIP